MIRLQEICLYLDQFFSIQNFEDSCPNGLQVEGKKEIKKIATAVTANLETIEACARSNADLLIVHHGMFWNRGSFPIVGIKKEKIELLLKNNISLAAYHLPMDAHPVIGNNWGAAIDLGWQGLEPFGKFNKMTIGVRGSFAPIERDEFIKTLENYYQHPAHLAPGGPDVIGSAALISGGAHRELQQASLYNVDAYITGSFDEPNWYGAKELGINFVAMGHSATERKGPMALASFIADTFSIPTEFIDIYNPF